jgi:hypothetical protein
VIASLLMKWCSISGLVVVGVCLGGVGCGSEETICPDPAEGEVEEACGVWVSATLGDDANPGTRAQPVASLQAAAERANLLQVKQIYACGNEWAGPVVLPRSVSLYGGFDCVDRWTYRGASHRGILRAGPGEIPLKTAALAGKYVVADFYIQAADAEVPGGSSIAVLIGSPDEVLFRRSTIWPIRSWTEPLS